MELQRALDQISEIHAHVARGSVFRGYRALTMALTGLVALLCAALQELVLPTPDLHTFVLEWVAAAGACAVICGMDLWRQRRTREWRRLRQRTVPVLAQFVPAIVVGAVLTGVLVDTEHAVLLPGLWATVYGLGVFSSRPFLPRAVGWVTLFYLTAGAVLLATADPTRVPGPWGMGAAFGIGQLFLALVLHVNLERRAA
jgi:hypothetical protein